MGMGMGGNGNNFMGMGGNGNSKSHSRTPLLESDKEELAKDAQQLCHTDTFFLPKESSFIQSVCRILH